MKSIFWLVILSGIALTGCRTSNSSTTQDTKRPEPPVVLGTYTQISISSKNIEQSLPFYEKLGFKVLNRDNRPFSAILLSDGVIHLRLEQNTFASPRLDYVYGSALDRDTRVRELTQAGISITRSAGLAEFADPNGLHIALVVRQLPPPPPNKSFSNAGAFGELAVHTADRDRSIAFYSRLGFEAQSFDQPYPWALLRDGATTIGVHQSPEFLKPTITYFSKSQPERIAKLKQMGLTFHDEKKDRDGQVANATLTSPDGQDFFLFAEE